MGLKDLCWCTNSHHPCGPSTTVSTQLICTNLEHKHVYLLLYTCTLITLYMYTYYFIHVHLLLYTCILITLYMYTYYFIHVYLLLYTCILITLYMYTYYFIHVHLLLYYLLKLSAFPLLLLLYIKSTLT